MIEHLTNCKCGKCNLPFVPIHLHTSHSALDGCAHIDDYVKLAQQFNHPGIAITDHGSPTALYEFYRKLRSKGLKPILGLEFYMCQDLDVRKRNKERELWQQDKHQSILIKNDIGYKNFCKLTWLSFNEGYYYKPRINYEQLFENRDGLMATSSCMASYINQCIANDDVKEAEIMWKKFVQNFGDDFYGEIQFNEITKHNPDKEFNICQKQINDFVIKMCKKYDTPLLIGGDIHYAHHEDHTLQDIVINTKRASKEGEEKKESFIHARHLYYHSSQDYFEFNEKFGFNYDEQLIREALDNSVQLLDKVNFEFDTKSINFPKFRHEQPISNQKLLEKLSYDGLFDLISQRRERGEKFSDDLLNQYDKRIKYELQIIEEKQITDYFLICADVCNWSRENHYRTGIARGCFVPESIVTLSNGKTKQIQDIEVGDEIIGRNGEDEVVFKWEYYVEEELVELELENGDIIKCTSDHEILTHNRGYVKAGELTIEDDLVTIFS